MANDGLTELAKLFKERNSVPTPSITTGVVISSPPNLMVRLNDVIVLNGDRLIVASHMVSGYQRNIKFTHNDLQVDTVMEWTDTIKAGEEVILMPVADGQLYYVLDKAVKFE